MGRYIKALCRLCRRENIKLFLKGNKCYTNCLIDKGKKKGIPGMHPKLMVKLGGYGKHLREKQKAKRMAGINEEQFRNYFRRAEQMKGLSGENLLILLERRLDNVIQRMGFAPSKQFARQIVSHGHVLVNNRIRRVPAYEVKIGDKITLKTKLHENLNVKKAAERPGAAPSWLNVDKTKLTGEVVALPTRQEVSYPVDETMIVELYSK
jgi:small subunit ribosomal protein S4